MAKTPSLKASKRPFALSLRSRDDGLTAQTSEIASFVVYSGDRGDPHEGEIGRAAASKHLVTIPYVWYVVTPRVGTRFTDNQSRRGRT